MKITSQGVQAKIEEIAADPDNPTVAEIQAGVSEWWGLEITDDDVQAIWDYMDEMGQSFNYSLAHVISARYTVFGWTTHGHNAEDVPIWSFGPRRIVGGIDNTDIARRIASAFGFRLPVVQQLLFQDLEDYFPGYTLDTSDPANPVVTIGSCSLPTSKDELHVQGMANPLIMPGLTVHAPMTDRCYASLVAIAAIQAFEGQAKSLAPRGGFAIERDIEDNLRALAQELQIDPDLAIEYLMK
jgi:alkaline phosphatase